MKLLLLSFTITIAACALPHRGRAEALEPGGGDLWSLTPIGHPEIPPLTADWQRNPVDAFYAHRPGPQGERRALIRRASYGLTGLPPAPADVERFVNDPRPDAQAFAPVVERLLESPHYGEHWGRHWLDLARYADTAGENSDHPLPHAWRYRNWVIAAFNDDMPYERFIKEQLAGDLLPRADADTGAGAGGTIATGYLAIARRFGHDIDKSMHLTYEDAIDNIGKVFLGLTISCARCHDHKHDPITARDYYALYGVLESTRFSYPGCEPNQQPRDLIPIATGKLRAEQQAWQELRGELQQELAPFAADEARRSEALGELAAACSTVISAGDVPDGESARASEQPIRLKVTQGAAIQLSILPRGNHGADTTILEFSISHRAESWSVADLIDRLGAGNPNGSWCFLDTSGEPQFLPEQHGSVGGLSELRSWSKGDTPSVFVNTSEEPVKVWTTLPPRTFFVHPGPAGAVALAWLSPVEGEIAITLRVADAHPGGDGVAWRLEHFSSAEIASAYRQLGAVAASRRELDEKLRDHLAREPEVPLAYAVADGEAAPARLQRRGDPEDLGEEVPRAFLGALGGGALGDDQSSGRLQLAERIASRDNPLTARVMANRIWAGHFGRGIVATPNDFGRHGTPPTDRQLLDFLARYLIDSGWSIKAMHRLIMASATYQQAAGSDLMPRRRLSAEELRDTLLVAGGQLDRTPGAAHPFPAESSWSFTQHAPFAADYASDKRSVYLMQKRNRRSHFFTLFDGADPNASTATRSVTTSPTQALYFMNDPFFHRCAEAFAGRILGHSRETQERLDFACRELYARPATPVDLEVFTGFARASGTSEDAAWHAFARVLLSSNELLHID